MIGRREEQRLLKELASGGEAEFVVVYGRRRIGKTYLVRETFDNEFFFSYTGVANIKRVEQLREFAKALRAHGWQQNGEQGDPSNWFEAFDGLREIIEAAHARERLLIFMDEMPWMDNKKSDFVSALESWWNGWASAQKNIMFIVCGSAASWLTKKVFRNKGGLYNRVTRQMRLRPFTLAECREYLDSRKFSVSDYDLIECYMAFGGIPYYLRMLDRKYSIALNVDQLCFVEGAPLRTEFKQLFETLFEQAEKHIEVVRAINSKKKGIAREEIAAKIDFGNGGNLTRILDELEASGFIRKYKPFGKREYGALYQLADQFTAFHLDFISRIDDENYWSAYSNSPGHSAWSGYAFEQVCLAHIDQIKRVLGISGVISDVSSWRSSDPEEQGAQVDLVIDRKDHVINLCEMKYTGGLFMVDKDDDLTLRNKAAAFSRETKTKSALHLTLVTTYGLKQNSYSSIFQSVVAMTDLIGAAG
jgi:AAA+ ATPase superfamily predicted ATPase